jgi:hypothetical protein
MLQNQYEPKDIDSDKQKLEKYVQLVYVLEKDPFEGCNRKI